jgi:excisionase family DNA binding protein
MNCRGIGYLNWRIMASDFYTQLEHRRGFLTVEEFASELKVSPKSIYRLVQKGILPSVRVGKQIRLEAVTTAQWLRERTS